MFKRFFNAARRGYNKISNGIRAGYQSIDKAYSTVSRAISRADELLTQLSVAPIIGEGINEFIKPVLNEVGTNVDRFGAVLHGLGAAGTSIDTLLRRELFGGSEGGGGQGMQLAVS